MSERQLRPFKIIQGVNEKIARHFIVTDWGSSPSGVVVTAWNISGAARVNVSSTVLIGAVTVTGDEITTPLIGNLTAGVVYRIDIRFTLANGNTYEPYCIIVAEE